MRLLSLIVASFLLLTANCKPGAQPFEPESVYLGDDGILYMFAPSLDAVYRFLVSEDRYLPKIATGSNPKDLTYVADHDALYVAYSSSQVEKIDLAMGLPVPEPFVQAPSYVDGTRCGRLIPHHRDPRSDPHLSRGRIPGRRELRRLEQLQAPHLGSRARPALLAH